MSYELSQERPLPAELRQVAVSEIDAAVAQLREEGPLDRRVHEARKHFKKLRGLLALMRGCLDRDARRRETETFRNLGRRLAGARESAALLEALDRLEQDEGLSRQDADPLRARLEAERARRAAELDAQVLEGVVHDLVVVRARVQTWELRGDGFAALAPGFERCYQRGRRALERCRNRADAERFHEWRKQVKTHMYHLRLLEPCWPALFDARESECSRLAELLGDDHDLADLARWFGQLVDTELNRVDPLGVSLSAALGRRSSRLRSEALRLGQYIYAEPPRDLVRRVGRYYALWRGHV